jgi:peptidoglycan-associated lipoprotein
MKKGMLLLIILAAAPACGSKPKKTTTPSEVVDGTPLPAADKKKKAEPSPESAVSTPDPGSGRFDPIYFDYDLADLRQEARDELVELSRYLEKNPTTKLFIYGHADERGTPEYNIALGLDRAKAARAYLVRLGVEEKRVTIKSYGEEQPAVEGGDEVSYQKNRRAEFEIVSDARAGAR